MHAGDLEIDYESSTWDDWDENCHGTMDTEDNQEEYPEGFVWSCCNKTGEKRGCRQSVHRPDRTKRVRT